MVGGGLCFGKSAGRMTGRSSILNFVNLTRLIVLATQGRASRLFACPLKQPFCITSWSNISRWLGRIIPGQRIAVGIAENGRLH